MSELHVLVGLPAAGKSTLAEKLKIEHNAVVLSSDKLREELLGDENNQDKNVDVFAELHNRANQLLSSGQNVILDATHINRKRRIHLISNEIKADKYHVYYMNTPFELCLSLDSTRERTVGHEVIDRMYKNMHIPTILEGWNTVTYIVNKLDSKNDLERTMQRFNFKGVLEMDDHDTIFNNLTEVCIEYKNIIDVSQDSSYHSFSISRHIFYVHQYVLENYTGKRKEEMLIASLFHDIGKGHCKSFYNYKGEEKRYASFLGHESTSSQTVAYALHSLGYDVDFIKYVVDLIQFHMMPMDMSVKTEKKLKQLLTSEQYEDLMFLHEADLSAK